MNTLPPICFDMDGTLADLYGCPNWLDRLREFDPTPYIEAKPMLPLKTLARHLNRLQNNGHKLVIISWLSKESTPEYDEAVRQAKRRWLAQHLPSVVWDEIHLVKYGTPKHFVGSTPCSTCGGLLFDDSQPVRRLWGKYGKAYTEEDILSVLRDLE